MSSKPSTCAIRRSEEKPVIYSLEPGAQRNFLGGHYRLSSANNGWHRLMLTSILHALPTTGKLGHVFWQLFLVGSRRKRRSGWVLHSDGQVEACSQRRRDCATFVDLWAYPPTDP